jgi:hypothetical protein
MDDRGGLLLFMKLVTEGVLFGHSFLLPLMFKCSQAARVIRTCEATPTPRKIGHEWARKPPVFAYPLRSI